MHRTFAEISRNIQVEKPGRVAAMNAITFIGDVYVYGVWSGMSTNFEVSYLENNLIEYRKMFGFDSFMGFPEEKNQSYLISDMDAGGFSSAELYKSSPNEAAKIIAEGIGCDKLKLVSGYFSDSLTEDLIKEEKMGVASFIDIDADLYSSTYQALEFMFSNELVVSGTIIYFDDWGATDEYKGGESLAWKEIGLKYNVKCKRVFTTGSGRSIQKVFRIL